MNTDQILKSDYLDILFDGRNKAYGGYELRRKYPQRMRNASFAIVMVTAMLVAASIAANAIKGKNANPVIDHGVVTLSPPPNIDMPKPHTPPPPPPPPVRPTIKFTPPVIRENDDVDEQEKPPEVDQLADKLPGLKTVSGDPDAIPGPGITEPGTGVVVAPAPAEIFTYVQQMPEAAYDLNGYLAKNTRYPDAAREAGIDGRVNVQFVVNEDGHISDVKVVGNKRLGGGLEDEAVRVVRTLPKWKPGKQNGRAVKVYFTLPVLFRLE